ncbi:MAG TPA: hypothetical protein VF763_05715 [Candidatus Limnocylindrales bacterium]
MFAPLSPEQRLQAAREHAADVCRDRGEVARGRRSVSAVRRSLSLTRAAGVALVGLGLRLGGLEAAARVPGPHPEGC